MLTIKRIDEADYGCEERLPGEPLMVLVTLEGDEGIEYQMECADSFLVSQDLHEGDEWPEDEEKIEEDLKRIEKMAAFMDNYLDALEELEE